MLNQKTIDRLKELGIDTEKLTEAIKSETEVEIKLPEGKLYKDADLESRDSNMKSEGEKLGFGKGKDAMKEIANKAIIEKFGLKDVQKTDELTKILDASFTTASKGDEGLKKQVQDLLGDKLKLSQEIEGYQGKIKEKDNETKLLSSLPKNRSSILNDLEYLGIVKNHVKEVDGVLVVEFNGEVLKDETTRSPLPIDKGIEKIFASREGWIKTEAGGGRGGDDFGGGGTSKPKSLSEATAKWEKDNPDKTMASPEFQGYINELAKDKDFKLDD